MSRRSRATITKVAVGALLCSQVACDFVDEIGHPLAKLA